VLDRHTGRTLAYGKESQPKAKSYFAMKEWLRKASQAEDMTLEEGQAANWVVGRLLSPDLSLTDKQILAKIKSGNTLKEGETYADIILNDPKVNRLAREVIAKFGGTPDEVFADLRKITERRKSQLLEGSKKEASNPTLKSYLGRAVKGRDIGKQEITPKISTPVIQETSDGVSLVHRGKKIGYVSFRFDGEGKNKTAEISGAQLDPEFLGKGLGLRMYEAAAARAKNSGAKELTSNLSGMTSDSAERVWARLISKGHPIERIESEDSETGKPYYSWKLGGK
jgi:GNAT superfamily N-acetyltransferase